MTRRVLLLETTLLSFVAVAVLLAGALATLAGTAWSSVTSGSRRGGVTCVFCRVTIQYALVNVRDTDLRAGQPTWAQSWRSKWSPRSIAD